jgi:hypothetical protein
MHNNYTDTCTAVMVAFAAMVLGAVALIGLSFSEQGKHDCSDMERLHFHVYAIQQLSPHFSSDNTVETCSFQTYNSQDLEHHPAQLRYFPESNPEASFQKQDPKRHHKPWPLKTPHPNIPLRATRS